MRHGAGAHGGIAAQCVDVLARQRDARARLGGGDPPALGHEQQGTANDEVNHPGHGGNVPDGRSRQRTTWRAPLHQRSASEPPAGAKSAGHAVAFGAAACPARSGRARVRFAVREPEARRHRARVVRVPVVVLPRLERLPPGVDRLGSFRHAFQRCMRESPHRSVWADFDALDRGWPPTASATKAVRSRDRAHTRQLRVSLSARMDMMPSASSTSGISVGSAAGVRPATTTRVGPSPNIVFGSKAGCLDATHQWSGPQSLQLHTGDLRSHAARQLRAPVGARQCLSGPRAGEHADARGLRRDLRCGAAPAPRRRSRFRTLREARRITPAPDPSVPPEAGVHPAGGTSRMGRRQELQSALPPAPRQSAQPG